MTNVLAGIRHQAAEVTGRRPEAGLLLLRDLRQLFLMAHEAGICWIALGQVAQAVRDHDKPQAAWGRIISSPASLESASSWMPA